MTEKDYMKVLDMLTSQDFKSWYDNVFEAYICGDEGCLSSQEILTDLQELLN